MAATAPQQTVNPRVFMRPQLIDLGTQAITLGGNAVTFNLRPLGYLSKLLVHVTGTYTVANAALVFLAYAPWNLVKLFNIVTPQSPQSPISAGGLSMHRWNLRASDFAPWRQGFETPASARSLDAALATTAVVGAPYNLDGSPTYDAIADGAPVTVGAETLHLWYVLPFALSVDDVRGVLPLGNSTVTTLQITPNTAAGLVTVAANLTLPSFTVQVVQEVLSPPPAGSPIDPTLLTGYIQAFDETFQAIVAVGSNHVTMVPNFTILGIAHAVRINGVDDSGHFDFVNLRMNSSRIFDGQGIDGKTFAFWAARTYGRALPEGDLLFDFDVLRDLGWVRTAQITDLVTELVINSAAVIGAGDGIMTSVRRLVPAQRAA